MTLDRQSTIEGPVHPLYTRIAVLGLLLFALGIVLHMVLSFIQGATDDLAFFAVFVVSALVVAGLAWRLGTWALAVAAAFALINLGVHGQFLLYPLRHPSSAFDFSLSLLVAAAVAFAQQRRGIAPTTVSTAERSVLGVAAAVLVGLFLLSGVLALTGRTTVSMEARARAIEVDMRKIRFEPDRVEIESGNSVKLVVKNSDFTLHTFTLEALGIDREILPRSEIVIEIPPTAAGTYRLTCEVPGHEDMKGIFVVSP